MKKSVGKLISLIVSAFIAIGVFAGCDLMEVNTDRDMEQKIATVQVEGAQAEDIYKRELINGYISYGYYYTNYYGYTLNDTYDLILNNLINNKVIVQFSRLQLANKKTNGADYAGLLNMPAQPYTKMAKTRKAYIESLLPYVTQVQVANAVYSAKTNINSILDSFEETSDTAEETENESVTPRTTPTASSTKGTVVNEAYAEKLGLEKGITEEDLTDEQKTAYDAWRVAMYTSYPMEVTQASRKAAAKSFIDAFNDNGLMTNEEVQAVEKAGKQYDFTNYTYYLDIIASSLESAVISNYEDFLTETAEAGINDDALWDEYLDTYNTQKATYSKDYSAYESALNGATADSYILYNPEIDGLSYGYVANILIIFSDAATNALKDFKAQATTQKAIDDYREELLKTLVAKDLRATWLQNGYYEYDKETNTYAFGSDYVKTENLKQFFGEFTDNTDYDKTTTEYTYHFDNEKNTWVWGDEEKKDFKADFTDIMPKEFTFAQFFDIFKEQFDLTGDSYEGMLGEKWIDNDVLTSDALDLIDDFLFAFGGDGGSFNKYLGYLYSPKTSAAQYVPEFAEAQKVLVNEKGVGSYAVVATDYGYHLMICTKVVEAGDVYAGKTEFKADLDNENSVAAKFKQAKIDANVEKLVQDVVTYNISKYIDKDNDAYAIKKYSKTYSNLISESSEK